MKKNRRSKHWWREIAMIGIVLIVSLFHTNVRAITQEEIDKPSIIEGYEVEKYWENSENLPKCTSENGIHDWGKWRIGIKPTCTGIGTAGRYCNICDFYELAALKALPHTWDTKYTRVQEPKCNQYGVEYILCTVCGNPNEESERLIDRLPHTLDETKWVIDQEAACLDGTRKNTCTVCGMEVTETVLATIEHDWSDWRVYIQAKPDKDGWLIRNCSICRRQETKKYSYVCTEHTYTWEVTKEASCTVKGEKTGTCSVCGATIKEEIVALGHKWSDWKTVQEPTYTETGLAERTCSRCNKKETKELELAP